MTEQVIADRTSRFWDRIARKYAAQPVPDEEVYQTKLRMTREYFRPESEVFEFGCGTGSTAVAHAPYVKHFHAIDFSERMLEFARGKAEAAGAGNVTFERAEIDTFDVPAESYDVVLGLSILHLLKDKDAVIAKVFRMLMPGGVFVSSTTCIGDTMRFLKYVAPIGRALGLLPQLDVMTRKELADSLTGAGFEIVHNWLPKKGAAVFIIAKKPGA